MKKIMLLVLMVVLSLVMPRSIRAITDSEFDANEDYYRKLCSTKITKDSQETCNQYQGYVNRKLDKLSKDLKSTANSIEDIKANLQTYLEQAKNKQQEIEQAEKDIVSLENQIVVVENNIADLEVQIKESEAEISRIDEEIRSRMLAKQSDLFVNNMVNFIFGAQSYTEMQRNADIISRINQQDQDLMNEYEKVVVQLNDDKVEVQRQQVVLQDSLHSVTELKKGLEIAKAGLDKLIVTYREQEAQLLAQQAALEDNKANQAKSLNTIKSGLATYKQELEAARKKAEQERLEAERKAAEANKPKPTPPPVPSDVLQGSGSGWIYPVNGNFRVTAGAWYYPGSFQGSTFGNVHYGVDIAASMGTPIVATGPGIVINTNTGCPTWGYLGNMCGYGGGNKVQVLYSMNNKLYSLLYAHMQSVNVRQGQVVTKGQQLGTLGSSGSSTGPHLHHEIIYVSNKPLDQFLETWSGTLNFTPNGQWMDLSWACENRGNQAPCRVNPQTWYGFKVGASY